VGRTPRSAAGPLTGHRPEADEGVGRGPGGPPHSAWILFLGWWLCQPVCLFGFSWLTGNSVFVRRYLFLMLPGVALTATAAVARFIPAVRLNRLAAVLGAAGLLALGDWGHLWPAHEHSDWRGAARKVDELALGPETPVICPSPFIEARPPVWRPDYAMPGFLYAHLPVYPVAGKTYLFPLRLRRSGALRRRVDARDAGHRTALPALRRQRGHAFLAQVVRGAPRAGRLAIHADRLRRRGRDSIRFRPGQVARYW